MILLESYESIHNDSKDFSVWLFSLLMFSKFTCVVANIRTSFLFKKKILEYSWSTMLCWFQMYSKVNQLYTYRYPFFFRFFFHIDHYRVGEGNGTALQYSCLENPIDRGAWGAAVHGVAKSGHDCATSLSLFTFMHWRRKWQPTTVFLPGESQGRGSLIGCRLWGRTESDTTEAT